MMYDGSTSSGNNYFIHPKVNEDRVIFLPEATTPKFLKMFNTSIFLETPFSREIVMIHYPEGSSPLLVDVNAGNVDPSRALTFDALPFFYIEIHCTVKGHCLEVSCPTHDTAYEAVDTRLLLHAIQAFRTIARRYHRVEPRDVSVKFFGNNKILPDTWYNEMKQVIETSSASTNNFTD